VSDLFDFCPYSLTGYLTNYTIGHAFKHGIDDKKTDKEFIWEYGKVFWLKYKSPF